MSMAFLFFGIDGMASACGWSWDLFKFDIHGMYRKGYMRCDG